MTQEMSDKGTKGLSGVVGVGVVKRKRRLSAEDKYQIFVEASRGDIPVAAVLRKWDLHSSDLARIRGLVRKGALEALAHGNGRVKEDPRIGQLKAEKDRVEEALKELAIENTLLRKKVD